MQIRVVGPLARPTPWFEPFLLMALREVNRGAIGTYNRSGALRHQVRDLPERLFSALFILYRDGHITLGEPIDGGWLPARLTDSGMKLLESWTRYLSHEKCRD